MCTLSWWITQTERGVFFNRDELRTRAHGLPPRTLTTASGKRILMPLDPDAGGTWIGVNESGLIVAVLNNYPHYQNPLTDQRSRGQLVVDLLTETDSARSCMEALDRLSPEIYRGFLLFAMDRQGEPLARSWAACNPGMYPASGLAMESKSEILASLNADTGKIATWCGIVNVDTIESRLDTLRAFQETLDVAWPIILKPDIGQRGEGVAVIRDEAQARRYLEANDEHVIAQKYISGAEFGVFYYRFPHESTGHIFSITEKVLPSLKGDGRSTIEELILHDARAVALAKHYLRVNAGRLTEVPAPGESVQLVELGTHCRGAIFLDGNRYRSEPLDAVLSTYDGFYFGRFDMRVPSGEAMAAGEDFSILELNGVSSESTDIYDPKNSISTAWRVLCRQWKLAFEIGAANRERGATVPSLGDIFAVLRGHRARQPFEAE